jgi:tetratricopeptide (TPR) repeat protein
LLAAGALFSDNQYAEALAQFRKFHDKYPNSNLAPIAAIGIAACLESQDITQEAIKAYQDVIARFPNESVAGQAKLALGRLYEGNKQPAQALKVYEELTRQTARSVWSSEANERREQLLLQHPELAPTNVPSTTLGSLAPTNLATAAAKPELISTSIVSQTNMLMPASTAAVSHVHATTNAPSPVVTNAIPQTNTSVAPASNAPSLPETNATSPKPGAGPAK